jgi:hypothetical protein
MQRMARRGLGLGLGPAFAVSLGLGLARVLLGACSAADVAASSPGAGPRASASAKETPAAALSAASVASVIPALEPTHELGPVRAIYPWGPASRERLDARFAVPPGFRRVDNEPGSFGEFLRTLPLLPDGAPVVDFRGRRLHDDGHHANISAVADLDVGARDLQHCADAIVRLHAEWRYGKGERDIGYRAVSGQLLSYRAWVSGERSFVDGKNLVMRRSAAPATDAHPLFRSWLDDVFSWAGTASIERDGVKVPSLSEVRPGDFFVMSGAPYGHAVLVLDVARDDSGRIALLLGQSYMPAQSFQILRPSDAETSWFVLTPGQWSVTTPFWRPFPASSLRRFSK